MFVEGVTKDIKPLLSGGKVCWAASAAKLAKTNPAAIIMRFIIFLLKMPRPGAV
jgi:hypothetical protein